MKVLICMHDYLPAHTGGSEVHAHQVAAELARRGHGVTSLFTERDLAAEAGSIREGILDGVRTLECVHQHEYQDVSETWQEDKSLEIFRSVLAEEKPDVVHFHHLAFWGARCVAAAREAGARVIVTLHDYHLLCDAATLLQPDRELCVGYQAGHCSACLRRHPLLSECWNGKSGDDAWQAAARARFEFHRPALSHADVVIAPSHFLAETFAAAGFVNPECVEVLRAGYPGKVHAPRSRNAEEPLRVGYVGGIYASKGVHVLVRAMAHLRSLPVELAIHGHLDWFPDYAAELRRSAEGSRVHFEGPFPPAEVDRILATIDVLVVPSLWVENMPITIQEAFRNGLPVVATDLGGMAEALAGGGGLTFARGDDRALAACLGSLVEDRQLYKKLTAARPLPPTLASVIERLEALYAG